MFLEHRPSIPNFLNPNHVLNTLISPIQTAVSLLTTSGHDPDEDYCGKLKRLLQYVRRNINIPLALRSSSLTIIKWWIYVSYVAHPDMRGHKGGTMPFSIRSVTGIANNNNINLGSSTEA